MPKRTPAQVGTGVVSLLVSLCCRAGQLTHPMYIFSRSPAEPETRNDKEWSRYACQRQAHHFFVARPGFVRALGAGQIPVPCQVEAGRNQGADADGEESEALFAGGEAVDAGEDYGVGL